MTGTSIECVQNTAAKIFVVKLKACLPHQQCWMAAEFSPRTFASFLCLCPFVDGSGGGGGDGAPCPGSELGPHPSRTGSGRAVPDRSLWAWRPGDAVSARTPSALWDWDQQSAEEGKRKDQVHEGRSCASMWMRRCYPNLLYWIMWKYTHKTENRHTQMTQPAASSRLSTCSPPANRWMQRLRIKITNLWSPSKTCKLAGVTKEEVGCWAWPLGRLKICQQALAIPEKRILGNGMNSNVLVAETSGIGNYIRLDKNKNSLKNTPTLTTPVLIFLSNKAIRRWTVVIGNRDSSSHHIATPGFQD